MSKEFKADWKPEQLAAVRQRIMEELLPCPFCGGEATMEEIPFEHLGITRFSVGCNNSEEEGCMGYQSLTTFRRKSDAVVAWNRRAKK